MYILLYILLYNYLLYNMSDLIKLCPIPRIDYNESDINDVNFDLTLDRNLVFILQDDYIRKATKGIDLEIIKKEMSNCKDCLSKGILIDTMKDFLDIHAKRSIDRIKNCTNFFAYNDKDVKKPLADKLQSIQDKAEEEKDLDMITCYSRLNSLVYNIISDSDPISRTNKYRERFPEFCCIDFTPIGTLFKDDHGIERRLSDEARQITGLCSDFDSGGDCIPGNTSTNADMPDDVASGIINIAISVLKSVLTPLDDINIKIKKAPISPISYSPKTFELYIEGISAPFIIKTGAHGYFTVNKLTSAIYPDMASPKVLNLPIEYKEVRVLINNLIEQLIIIRPGVHIDIIRKKVLCLLMCIKTAGDFIKMFVVYILNRFDLILDINSSNGNKLKTIDNIYFLTHDKSAMNLALCLNIHCLGGTGSATNYNPEGSSIRFLYWDSFPKWYKTNFKRKLTGLGFKFFDGSTIIGIDNIYIEKLVEEEDKLEINKETSYCPNDELSNPLNGGMPSKMKITAVEKKILAEEKEEEEEERRANRTADAHIAENENISKMTPRSRQILSAANKVMAYDFKNKTPHKKTGKPLYTAKAYNSKVKMIARLNNKILSETVRYDQDFHFARINLKEDYDTLNAAIITAMIIPDKNEAKKLITNKRKELEIKGYTRSSVLPTFLQYIIDASYMERYLSISAIPNDNNKTISVEVFYNKCLIQSLNRQIASVSSKIILTFQTVDGISRETQFNLFKKTILTNDDIIIEKLNDNIKIQKVLATVTKNFVNIILEETRTCCLAFVHALRLVDYLDPKVDIPYYTSDDYNLSKKVDYIKRLNNCMESLIRLGKNINPAIEERETENKGKHNCGTDARSTLQNTLPPYIKDLEISIRIYSELNKKYRDIYTYILKIIEIYNYNEKNISKCLTLIYLCETLLILVKFLCKLKDKIAKINSNIEIKQYLYYHFEVECKDENDKDRNNPNTKKLIHKVKESINEFFQGSVTVQSLYHKSDAFLKITENNNIPFISINGNRENVSGIENLLPIIINELAGLSKGCNELQLSSMQISLQNLSDVQLSKNPSIGGKYKKATKPKIKDKKPKEKKTTKPKVKEEKPKVNKATKPKVKEDRPKVNKATKPKVKEEKPKVKRLRFNIF